MQQWHGPLFKPNGEHYDPEDVPVNLPGDRAVDSEWELWRYIGKGLVILVVCAFLLTNAMYGLFALLVYLAGG